MHVHNLPRDWEEQAGVFDDLQLMISTDVTPQDLKPRG
jgi:hypothetical protein